MIGAGVKKRKRRFQIFDRSFTVWKRLHIYLYSLFVFVFPIFSFHAVSTDWSSFICSKWVKMIKYIYSNLHNILFRLHPQHNLLLWSPSLRMHWTGPIHQAHEIPKKDVCMYWAYFHWKLCTWELRSFSCVCVCDDHKFLLWRPGWLHLAKHLLILLSTSS